MTFNFAIPGGGGGGIHVASTHFQFLMHLGGGVECRYEPRVHEWEVFTSYMSWCETVFFLFSLVFFRRKSRKLSQPIRGQVGHLVFPISPKRHTLGIHGIGNWDLASLSLKFRWILFSSFRGEVENVRLSKSEAGTAILFFRSVRKHKLGRGHWDIASCQVPLNSKSKKSQPIKDHFVFSNQSQNTSLQEDVEILLLVNFVEFRSAASEKKSKVSQQIRRLGRTS